MSSRLFSGLAVLLLAAAPAAVAQSFDAAARPSAGTLSPPSEGEPVVLDLTIRGTAESGRPECPGYFEPSAPDAVVDWGGGRLRLTVRSSADATLLVVDPQGQWHCNDDGEGLAPVLDLAAAARGRYAVWVGSFMSGGGGAATLVAGAPPPRVRPDPDGTPQERVTLTGGFSGSGDVEYMVSPGSADAVAMLDLPSVSFCSGFVDAARPSAHVRYTAGGAGRLTFRATTDTADPVLLVRTADGTWLCDDDSGDGVSAALSVADAASGDYAVWVGTFSPLARAEAAPIRLAISEDEVVDADLEYMETEYEPTPYSTGTYQPLALDAAPRARLALRTDESVSTTVTVRPEAYNPVSGAACGGRVEVSPTAAVTLAGSGPVGVTATGEGDLVLLMRTPAGEWFCSDDADGLNPGIQVDQPESGTYLVWVGAFTEGDATIEATLTLARGEITVSQPDYGMDMGGLGQGEPFGEGAYDGPDLLVGQPLHTLAVANDGTAEAPVQAGGMLLNPVTGDTCRGFIDARPTAAVTLDAGGLFTATPAEADDLVLLVATPDGRWLCGDDAHGGPDPVVGVEGGAAGTYSVWVGTFSRRDTPVAATLMVTP